MPFLASGVLAVGLLTALSGCPVPGDGNGNAINGNTQPQPTTFGILNILSNAAFSRAVAITIFYSVPEDAETVEAFYRVLDAPANQGGEPIGIQETIAEGLPAGTNQTFEFDTTGLNPGFYQLGVRTEDETYFSVGTIELEGPPDPEFLEPLADVIVRAGDEISVVVDIRDPEGEANWRLFFQDADAPLAEEGQAADGSLLGTRLGEGEGNSINFAWDTSNVTPGEYRLGVSATDVGATIGEVVAAGDADAIVTTYSDAVVTIRSASSAAEPPVLTFTTNDQTVLTGDTVEIVFSAETFEGDQFLVTLYYVLQDGTDDGEEDQTVFATITDPGISSAPFDTEGLDPGIYEIGGTVDDGVNPPVEVDEDERVLINVLGSAEVQLAVTSPALDRQVAQGDVVEIEWSTNVPPETGRTSRVFARACTDCSEGDLGEEPDIPIADGLSLNVTSASWDTSDVTGRHVVLVEMTLEELTDPVLARAPGIIRVSAIAPQIWMGSLGQGLASRQAGEVFQGVNFQDNAGTFLNSVGDYNGDGKDELVIAARYGKPFFQNPTGVGIGEGYLVFGAERQNRTINLNQVGTSQVPGLVFTGITPRGEAQSATDGLSSVRQIPDQDGDSLPELMFGFPFVDSEGQTVGLLEKARQFLRGGVVIVSSRNGLLSAPSGFAQRGVIPLDWVGQAFNLATPGETINGSLGDECDRLHTDFFFSDDNEDDELCTVLDACDETFDGPFWGFNRDLADSYTAILRPFSFAAQCTGLLCGALANATIIPSGYDGLCAAFQGRGGIFGAAELLSLEDAGDPAVGSAFYPLRYCRNGVIADNEPLEPLGARIIGRDPGEAGDEVNTGDRFGTSSAVSGGFLLITAPNRQPLDNEVTGISGDDVPADPGVVYLFSMTNLWPDWRDVVPIADDGDGEIQGERVGAREFVLPATAPPMPYQYQIDEPADQCGNNDALRRPFIIMGEDDQKIETVDAISDFNLDGREDFVIGAPFANSGDGAVYVAYRRDPSIEGDYVLSQLSRSPDDVERLAGLRINGRTNQEEGLGETIGQSLIARESSGFVRSEGIDFNGDGVDDLVLGNPHADNDRGEVIIVFGTDDLISPQGGLDLSCLLNESGLPADPSGLFEIPREPGSCPLGNPPTGWFEDEQGNPRAIRIAGENEGDLFGFNITVAGDFDGDGNSDLLVAAPEASPMFDSNEDGIPDTPGIDVVNLDSPEAPFGDGFKDDVNGDGVVNAGDNLANAGLVYLILGSNDLVSLAAARDQRKQRTIPVLGLGRSDFRGLMLIGRDTGDQLGGGIEIKRDRRSFGVGAAGDVDGDGRDDILVGSILADPGGRTDAGEAYLIYGFSP
jgi:hypothetical protein